MEPNLLPPGLQLEPPLLQDGSVDTPTNKRVAKSPDSLRHSHDTSVSATLESTNSTSSNLTGKRYKTEDVTSGRSETNPSPEASLAASNEVPPTGAACRTETIARQPREGVQFIRDILHHCSTPNFASFVRKAGLEFLRFEPNPHAAAGHVIHDRFVKACKRLTLAIAFHGTPADNIPNILEHGLDPNKRKVQSCGPGE